jgi:hypothetical protein
LSHAHGFRDTLIGDRNGQTKKKTLRKNFV